MRGAGGVGIAPTPPAGCGRSGAGARASRRSESLGACDSGSRWPAGARARCPGRLGATRWLVVVVLALVPLAVYQELTGGGILGWYVGVVLAALVLLSLWLQAAAGRGRRRLGAPDAGLVQPRRCLVEPPLPAGRGCPRR